MEEGMSIEANPYQSPETTAVPVKPLAAQGALTENMLVYLKGASPWLRFVGILGFISAGLAALSGLGSFAFVPLMGMMDDLTGVFGAVFGGTMAVLSIAGAVLVFIPSLFLYRFGEKIRRYLRTGVDLDLEEAFRNNKSFWKFTGIVCIVYLAFIPVLIVGSIIVTVFAVLG